MRHAICELGSERLGVTAMQQGAGMVMVGTTLARAPFWKRRVRSVHCPWSGHTLTRQEAALSLPLKRYPPEEIVVLKRKGWPSRHAQAIHERLFSAPAGGQCHARGT